jgi:cysteine synthase A
VVVCEPDNSQVYASPVRVPWPDDGVPRLSHPEFSPHPVQGWAPDFVPKLAEDARALVDEIVPVSGRDALDLPRALARREGIFTGISGGATLAGALAIARRAAPGARILCMLPDTGERYQSTPLFADIAAEMNDEERALAESTPSARFDRAGATAAAAPPPLVGASERARAFVAQALSDRSQPVVLFALEWCEFCWAVRKLFARCKIAYRSVDIGSVAYKPEHFGTQIRAALHEHSGMRTIPQVFVAGQLIGGTSETFAAFASGKLQTLLREAGVSFQDTLGDQLYTLLPGWVQRR